MFQAEATPHINADAPLGQIARWNQVPYDVVEEIAQRLAKERGLDLEKREFNQMCQQVRDILAIPDQGYREWKLQSLARQYKRSRRELIEAYSKALDVQTPTNPLSLSDLKAASKIEHQWLIQGWVPSGVTILLHALGGTGKSLFLYGIATAIAKGEPWNDYPTRAGSVLILQSDDPPHVTQERLEIMGVTDADPLQVVAGWQVEAMPQLEALLDRRRTEGNPVRFILVDSVTGVNKTTSISENDVEYARPVMQLTDLAAKYDCTIAIVHHSNGYGEARGTKAIHNSVSEVWHLITHNETTGERLLRVQKNRVGRSPGRYLFDFDPTDYAFTYKGESDEDGGASATHEKRIELWLNEANHKGTPYEAEEIVERLAIPGASVRRALNTLWEKGLIQRDRRTEGKRNYFLYWICTLKVSDLLPLVDRSGRSPIDQQNPLTELVDQRDRQNPKIFTNASGGGVLFADRTDQTALGIDGLIDRTTPLLTPIEPPIDQNQKAPNNTLRRLVVYKGNNQALIRLCGKKHLEILSETPTCAEVRHPDWLVTQTIPLIDLKPVK